MKRYLLAYAAWLGAVLVMAGIALAWYRHVEEIGWRELGARLTNDDAGNTSNDSNVQSGDTSSVVG